MNHGSAAFRLGQHDGVRACRHHGVEVGVDQPGGEAVDAHDQARPVGPGQRLREKVRRPGARGSSP